MFVVKSDLLELSALSHRSQPLASCQGRMNLAFALFVFILITTYPRYLEILLDPAPTSTYAYFYNKINAPFTPYQGAQNTHGSKLSFRFTVPLLANALNIGKTKSGYDIIFLYLLQSLLLFPFFLLLIKLLQRYVNNTATVFFSISFAAIYLASAFFCDYDFWFDGFAYFFLLLGMYLRHPAGIFCALQMACWTDERAVIALASVYVFHHLQENDFNLRFRFPVLDWSFLTRNSTLVLGVGVWYGLLRAILSYNFKLYTPLGEAAGVSLSLIPFQLEYRFMGIVSTFEGLWLVFLLAIGMLIYQKKFFLAFGLSALMLVHILVAYSVYDITRSLTYAFPLLIIAGILVARQHPKNSALLFLTLAVLCLLFPTGYMIYFFRPIPWTIESESITTLNAIMDVMEVLQFE